MSFGLQDESVARPSTCCPPYPSEWVISAGSRCSEQGWISVTVIVIIRVKNCAPLRSHIWQRRCALFSSAFLQLTDVYSERRVLWFYAGVWVCVCVCMCGVCTHVCMHTCACACRDQRKMLNGPPYHSLHYSFKMGSLTEPGANLVVMRPQRASCPHTLLCGSYKYSGTLWVFFFFLIN